MFTQLSIIAPGLLGGSVAQAARERGLAQRISIWARRAEVRQQLAAQAWCDATPESLGETAQGADCVVIAAPVTHIVPLLRELAPQLSSGALVTDVGSVKAEICHAAQATLAAAKSQAHFVGAHPMAGSEKTGWEHGTPALFAERSCFVTPLPETPRAATEAVATFWQKLGSRVTTVAPELHDQIVAHISHLPQALASTLCAMLARTQPSWAQYAGGGLRDTTRIAASDPQLWRTIFEQNRSAVLHALDNYEAQLRAFREALAQGDYDKLSDALTRGRDLRRSF